MVFEYLSAGNVIVASGFILNFLIFGGLVRLVNVLGRRPWLMIPFAVTIMGMVAFGFSFYYRNFIAGGQPSVLVSNLVGLWMIFALSTVLTTVIWLVNHASRKVYKNDT